LREIAQDLGGACAASSLAVYALPLFAAWLIYAVISFTRARAA
jgi:hypothetical protein